MLKQETVKNSLITEVRSGSTSDQMAAASKKLTERGDRIQSHRKEIPVRDRFQEPEVSKKLKPKSKKAFNLDKAIQSGLKKTYSIAKTIGSVINFPWLIARNAVQVFDHQKVGTFGFYTITLGALGSVVGGFGTLVISGTAPWSFLGIPIALWVGLNFTYASEHADEIKAQAEAKAEG